MTEMSKSTFELTFSLKFTMVRTNELGQHEALIVNFLLLCQYVFNNQYCRRSVLVGSSITLYKSPMLAVHYGLTGPTERPRGYL